jgi:ribosomal protein S12 methylthiotransferase accessory factor
MQLRSHPPSDLRLTLAALPMLVDPLRGPIRSLERPPLAPGDPQYVHYHALVGPGAPRPGRPATLPAGGSATAPERALAKAIGESVERCSVQSYAPARLHVATAAELGDTAVDPAALDLFHPAQRAVAGFPFGRLTRSSRVAWVEGYSLTRRRPAFVPAILADLYHRPRSPEEAFDECPVSGYACGNTLEEALLGALCEVVERDALMLAWYHRLAVPALDLGSFESPALREALERFRRSPVRIYCASITSDVGIPAVLVMMTSHHPNWPAAAVATAADLSAERAVLKALGELSSAHWITRSARPIPRQPGEVREMEDHGLFYVAPERLRHLDMFLRPRSTVRARHLAGPYSDTDVKANLDECLRRLAARDLEAIALEITAPEILALGFRVVKVLVPGLRPIDFGHRCKHLGGARLYEAPRRMGYTDTASDPSRLNQIPHPLP